ncbi:discoidin domain-containing protein [Methylocella silvestris]|nr:discoidin domain-containing protein [Methylocella silvestris]
MNPVVEALSLLTPYDIDKPKRRIGPKGDGGYVLVDDLSVDQAIVSYGISFEYEFDREMAEAGHDVYMFDHTIEGVNATTSRMHFFKEGVAGITDSPKSLYSIEDHLTRHNITGDRLILKIDVEGAEFDAFVAIGEKTLCRFEQIVMEIHNVNCLEDSVYRAKFCQMFRKINKFYTLFHVHANNCDGQNGIYPVCGIPVFGIIELSYIRSNIVRREPSRTLYPTSIDYPNTGHKDKLLWFFPFLPTHLTLENFAACEERVEYFHRLQQYEISALQAGSRLANVAIGKPASQSSLSEWSVTNEANKAVSGIFPPGYAFHTDFEDKPWWQIDLLALYPIERIVVHNRLDMLPERARTLKIEISHDGQNWSVIHAGIHYFSGGPTGSPLNVSLASRVSGRYVRLSLEERQALHLAQVEILVRPDLVPFVDFRAKHSLSNLKHRLEDPAQSWWYYTLEKTAAADDALPVAGLKINHSGRFGNLLEQTANAILLAQKTGLKYVQLGRHDLFDPKTPSMIDDLTLIPAGEALPADGSCVGGVFLHMTDFAPNLTPTEEEHCKIIRETIRPHVLAQLRPDGKRAADELTIHIRSGDIFDGPQRAWAWYRQPPLAFYKLIVDRLRAAGTISRVRLVYEDRGNPCIPALETYLTNARIPFRAQSGTLAEDLAALIDAPHLAFGFGTFGYAVCKLSTKIRSVHFFGPELNEFALVGGRYDSIPGIEHVYSIVDTAGEYIKIGDWANTPEQREMMIDYPLDALEISEVKGATK